MKKDDEERDMPIGAGAGKYDHVAKNVLKSVPGAIGVAVLIDVGDASGCGFSVKFRDPIFLASLPTVLRTLAEHIEAEMESHMLEIVTKASGGKA